MDSSLICFVLVLSTLALTISRTPRTHSTHSQPVLLKKLNVFVIFHTEFLAAPRIGHSTYILNDKCLNPLPLTAARLMLICAACGAALPIIAIAERRWGTKLEPTQRPMRNLVLPDKMVLCSNRMAPIQANEQSSNTQCLSQAVLLQGSLLSTASYLFFNANLVQR